MTELAGRYRLGEVIGTGGTATVYRATDTSLGVERAVKILRTDAVGAESQRARLRAEARAMARVAHPNILRIYDVGSDGDQDFVVMELAPGGSLQDRLDGQGPLPPLVACRYALQVLGALAAAHDAGVIHRDVKPQNVLLDNHGVAMLADFGIALLGDGAEARHTRVGVAMGSMTYMPPEQRLDARGVGVSADIYATGATVYALLTGASPVDLFLAAPGSVRWQDVPPPLCPVLQRATRLIPAERWGSAREMAAAILDAMESLPPDPSAHPEDDQAWSAIRDRVLVSLALPAADFTSEAWRGSRKPVAVGVDPTVHAVPGSEVRRPGAGRWVALGAAFVVVLGVGAWLWTSRVLPGSSQGVQTGPVPSATAPRTDTTAPAPPAPPPEAAPATAAAAPASEPAATAGAGAAAVPVKPTSTRPRTPRAGTNAAVAPVSDVRPAAGKWTGSWSGKAMRLELRGPDSALTGTVTVTFMGNEVVTAVRGSFDPATRRLELADVEKVEDSGRYSAMLTDEPAFDGRFTRESTGQVSSFRVRPAR